VTLAQARLYLVSRAQLRAGPLAELVAELAAVGVDVIQLREKEMEAGDVLRLAEPIAAACTEAGVPFIVNDRPDIALALGASGVHLGQNDLPPPVARRILGAGPIIGLSTHSRTDIETIPDGVNYIAVGPVFETPTKPGRPAAGFDLVEHAAGRVAIPWFAIGGINENNIEEILVAGGRRVVVVRAITEAQDPVAQAASLSRRLREVPIE
jgi:thiamine-phosphate pyrophosphorylase